MPTSSREDFVNGLLRRTLAVTLAERPIGTVVEGGVRPSYAPIIHREAVA